jgi:hypothetical protein
MLTACTKTTTTLSLSATTFGSNIPVENARIDFYAIDNVRFGIDGKIADIRDLESRPLDANGSIFFETDKNLEELGFNVTKEGFIDFYSEDNFSIQAGDEANLNIEMYERSYINLVMNDVPNINTNKLEVYVKLHEENIINEFNSGDHQLVKDALGDTENEIFISFDGGPFFPTKVFVPLRDTINVEIDY